jgi:protein-tyrosine-phosphatase
LSVESAGYFDWGSFPREAHPFARRAVQQLFGTDLLANHRARRWDEAMVAPPTRVVVAEEWMRADFPADRVVTMRELGGERGDVADPYGGDLQTYLDCARLVDRLIRTGLGWLTGGCA